MWSYGRYSLRKLSKSELINKALIIGSFGLMLGSLAYTITSSIASMNNYPGGKALRMFN